VEGMGSWPKGELINSPKERTSVDYDLLDERKNRANIMMLRNKYPDAKYDEGAEEVNFSFRGHKISAPFNLKEDPGKIFHVPDIYNRKVIIRIDGQEVSLAKKIEDFRTGDEHKVYELRVLMGALDTAISNVAGLLHSEKYLNIKPEIADKVKQISTDGEVVDLEAILAEMVENKDTNEPIRQFHVMDL